MLKWTCKSQIDQTRAPLVKGSNGVKITYRIDTLTNEAEASGNETISKVKKPEFSNPEDGTTKEAFTKATFNLKLGAGNSGCILQFYTRYFNSKYPENDGSWTGPYNIIIS
jgi:hypothetical protein